MSKSIIAKRNWKEDPLGPGYLVDSGLLFLINRTVLHPLGIALTVVKDEQGKYTWGFKDLRGDPASMLLEKNMASLAQLKLQAFLEEFGNAQMEKREKALGWACQRVAVEPTKPEAEDGGGTKRKKPL